MHRRRLAARLAKTTRSYLVEDVVKLYGVHKNTVRNWMKDGLQPIDLKRPLMFHGSALNAFHAARRVKHKRPCGPGELYCVTHGPQRPAGDMIEYEPINSKVGRVKGLCPVCTRMLSMAVNEARLEGFEGLSGHPARGRADVWG